MRRSLTWLLVAGLLTGTTWFSDAGALNGQGLYTDFREPAKTKRFQEVSHALRCLCGCGLVLAVCPHVNCGYGIPARRLIENRIENGESNQEIVNGFVNGFLAREPVELFAGLENSPAWRAYHDPKQSIHGEQDRSWQLRGQLLSRLLDISLRPPSEKRKKIIDQLKTGSVSYYFETKIEQARQRIAEKTAERDALMERARSGKITDQDAARARLYELEEEIGFSQAKVRQLNLFRVGYGPRVLARPWPVMTIIATALGILALGYLVFRVLRRRRRSGTSGEDPEVVGSGKTEERSRDANLELLKKFEAESRDQER